jgi:hypothetical protein
MARGCWSRTVVVAAAALASGCVAAGVAVADPVTACAPADSSWNRVSGSDDPAAMRAVIRTIPGVCTELLARARGRLSAAEAGAKRAARIERPSAPAGPPAAERVMSLADTLDTISNEIIAQGPVAFEGFAHDSDPPAGKVADWTYTKRMEYTAFSSDVPGCQLNFHFKLIVNGDVSDDKDAGVPLRVISNVKVAPETQLLQIRDAQAGHPTYSSHLQPAIYDVEVVRDNGGGVNEFSFYSLETAHRVARLFEQAASRCGAPISRY